MNQRSFDKYNTKNRQGKLEPCLPDVSAKKIAVMIPVFAEKDWLTETLESLAHNPSFFLDQALILLVVNEPPDLSIPNSENQDLLFSLRHSTEKITAPLQPGRNLFWIDATRSGLPLPSPGGVGWARKLGFDTLLKIWGIQSESIPFVSLDADTQVQTNYLSAIIDFNQHHPEYGGFTIPFQHRCKDASLQPMIQQYDHFLSEYVEGLKFACSPYAYSSMGSAMGTSNQNYLRCGGMKTHTGGEDFYFLQALRKIGPIGEVETTVFPAARLSDRVPFGTGPRLKEILQGKTLRSYPLSLFEELKKMLATVATCHETAWEHLPFILAETLSEKAELFLAQQNFSVVWQKIMRNTPRNDTARTAAFHSWFDAFKTLKFIHFLSDWQI